MRLPTQAAPARRARRAHPFRGVEPEPNGVVPQHEDDGLDEGEFDEAENGEDGGEE